MKRGEFLRRSALALVGLAIVPSLAVEPVEVLPSLPQRKIFAFKVSSELLQDKEAFDLVVNDFLPKYGNIKNMRIGFEDDDFIKNIHTIVLELA